MKSFNKQISLIIAIATVFIYSCSGQIKNSKTEIFKVYGNCETCKKKIETSVFKKKVSKGIWSVSDKKITLYFDSTKTTSEALLKKIAYAGYDNEQFMAPDEAYNALPACCQYARKQQKEAKAPIVVPVAVDTPKDTLKSKPIIKESLPLVNILALYFDLKDILVKDDGKLAALKASLLYKAISDVKMEDLNSSQHEAWMKYQTSLTLHTEKVKSNNDIALQREHFALLSESMYQLAKVANTSYSIYYDRCPMYDNGKGAVWISKEIEIKNPYFGAMMLGCGKNLEVIK